MTQRLPRHMSWTGTLRPIFDPTRSPTPGDGLTPEQREALAVAFPDGVPEHITVLLRPH